MVCKDGKHPRLFCNLPGEVPGVMKGSFWNAECHFWTSDFAASRSICNQENHNSVTERTFKMEVQPYNMYNCNACISKVPWITSVTKWNCIDLIFKITASKSLIFQLDGICYHRNDISLTVEGQWRNRKIWYILGTLQDHPYRFGDCKTSCIVIINLGPNENSTQTNCRKYRNLMSKL